MSVRLTAIYHVRGDAAGIAARARGIAVEQSVEMPVEAIDDAGVLADIVGDVQGIADLGDGMFEVRIGLAVATTGPEAGQLFNMLFGNTSLQDDVTLHDAELPAEVIAGFGGPNLGIAGLRASACAVGRAMTGTALKPQGLSPAGLAALAGRMGSISSRTITGWRTRATAHLPPGWRRWRRRWIGSDARPGIAPGICRACRAISMRCGHR
jgi:ribulose-bisphosphate carboxylase large chain